MLSIRGFAALDRAREPWNFFATLTLLVSQAHDSHNVVRRVKEREHGQVCKPVGQLVQVHQTERTHGAAQGGNNNFVYTYVCKSSTSGRCDF